MEQKNQIIFTSLDQINTSIAQIETDQIIIIADAVIWENYKKQINLRSDEKEILVYKVPSGEIAKSIKEYEQCLEFLVVKKVHRKAHIIAFGGGAISDMAGFVSATYLRGVHWSIIPTTLLSFVDASVGGKVAINLAHTKNQVGAFHNPDKIFISLEFLDTLSDEHFKSGLGEIAKYAFLSHDVFEEIEKGFDRRKIIEKCIEYKKQIVLEDPNESHQRKVLNLGHSLGHALELHYQMPHGIAVFWGMVLEALCFQNERVLEKLITLNEKLAIVDAEPPWLHRKLPIDHIISMLKNDKKIVSKNVISIPLIDEEGKVEIKELEISFMENLLREQSERIKQFVLSR